MAHKNWDSIDTNSQQFKEVYCAFLDILGYKNKSDDFFKNKFNLLGRIERALESTKKTIEISSIIIDIKEIDIQFFSDSIILTIPKSNNNLFKILHYSRVLSAYLSFEGLFLRGGISEGRHLETTTSVGSIFLASEALQKAYLLESKCAKNPRILIDNSLITNLTTEEKKMVFMENTDYILDFAPMIINNEGKNQNDVYLELENINKYINNTSSKSVKDKYQWVLDYYYWTITLSQNYQLSKFSKYKPEKTSVFKRI
jgi:hypothetical protein